MSQGRVALAAPALAHAVRAGLRVVIAVGGGLLIPALWLLFVVFKGHNSAQEAQGRADLSRPGEQRGYCWARRSCRPPSPLARIMPRDDDGTRTRGEGG